MKGILEFDLNEHFEKLAHKRAVSATEVYLVILNLQEHLRRGVKYGEDEAKAEVLQSVRDFLNETLEDYGIDMGDLE